MRHPSSLQTFPTTDRSDPLLDAGQGERLRVSPVRAALQTLAKAVIKSVLKLLYRVEVRGAAHMPAPGVGAVVVVNHVSYLDAVLLAAFLPGRPTFAIHTAIAKAWWMKPVLPFFDAFPLDTTNPIAAKAMVKAVRDGRTLVVFPEGRITVTGALMKIFAGSAMVAAKAAAPIVPVRVDGTQYTRFSHMKGKVRMRRFPRVQITILPARRLGLDDACSGHRRRILAGNRLYDVMSEMMFLTSDLDRTLFQALLDTRVIHGGKAFAVEDVKRAPLSYDRLIIGARLLAAALRPSTAVGEAVGVLMPNVNPTVVAFFALQAGGRIPALLNYTSGVNQIRAACDAAKVSAVLSSRAFVKQAKLEAVVEDLERSGRRVLWLEELAAGITGWAKLAALVRNRFGGAWSRRDVKADQAAVILFTSGTEGAAKAVVLSHRNILANCAQIAARIDFNPSDRVMNALPLFHSFGLTGATLLPILNGVRTMIYPNPLHYSAVPAFAYDGNATILFGSDTFLAGYARKADPYDFRSLRYVFAGAERVRPETRTAYSEKFGLRLLEGYGATECSPVLAVNTPMHFKAGSVGRLLPGVEARLETVAGIQTGGRLLVRGPNIMAGYYLKDAPGELAPPEGGWHDTGDIVSLDPAGFVTIVGRIKRFAKIGGEMVSLGALEECAVALWPHAAHAAVATPSPRKGEEVVLFSTAPEASVEIFRDWARSHGVADLSIPKEVRRIESLPVLGTGKPDYLALQKMAEESRVLLEDA